MTWIPPIITDEDIQKVKQFLLSSNRPAPDHQKPINIKNRRKDYLVDKERLLESDA